MYLSMAGWQVCHDVLVRSKQRSWAMICSCWMYRVSYLEVQHSPVVVCHSQQGDELVCCHELPLCSEIPCVLVSRRPSCSGSTTRLADASWERLISDKNEDQKKVVKLLEYVSYFSQTKHAALWRNGSAFDSRSNLSRHIEGLQVRILSGSKRSHFAHAHMRLRIS